MRKIISLAVAVTWLPLAMLASKNAWCAIDRMVSSAPNVLGDFKSTGIIIAQGGNDLRDTMANVKAITAAKAKQRQLLEQQNQQSPQQIPIRGTAAKNIKNKACDHCR